MPPDKDATQDPAFQRVIRYFLKTTKVDLADKKSVESRAKAKSARKAKKKPVK